MLNNSILHYFSPTDLTTYQGTGYRRKAGCLRCHQNSGSRPKTAKGCHMIYVYDVFVALGRRTNCIDPKGPNHSNRRVLNMGIVENGKHIVTTQKLLTMLQHKSC